MSEYTVKQGDCISSIAKKNGLFWEKVWDHPNNIQLKEKRKDPNILYPGDIVFVPEKEEKEESGATEKRHKFRKKGVPAKLHLQLLEDDEPRSNESYTLMVDGNLLLGTTDADGRLEQMIPPNAKSGKLLLSEGLEEYFLDLGHLDPVEEVTGLKARLNNLGYNCGPVDVKLDSLVEAALKSFQLDHELTVDGKPGLETQKKLKEIHGC